MRGGSSDSWAVEAARIPSKPPWETGSVVEQGMGMNLLGVIHLMILAPYWAIQKDGLRHGGVPILPRPHDFWISLVVHLFLYIFHIFSQVLYLNY